MDSAILFESDDRRRLALLIDRLKQAGFCAPKWRHAAEEIPVSELTCTKRGLRCDVVSYRDGQPIVVFELDGSGHSEEKQQRYDRLKEKLLALHGIRVWRMWNTALLDPIDVFRRAVKATMYAPPGAMKDDFSTQCRRCKKG